MKEYKYEITSINRDLTAQVFADSKEEADEMLKKELENDWELDLNKFDIELEYCVDVEKKVSVDECV
jgi:hypothetical protein